MSNFPFQFESRTENHSPHAVFKSDSARGTLSPSKLASFDQVLSKNTFILKPSQKFNMTGPPHDPIIFGARANKWAQGHKPFSRVPMRSSKNTIKMLQSMDDRRHHGKKSRIESNELLFRRNLSPRSTVGHRRDLAEEPVPRGSSHVVILPSVLPIISKKSRGSRTSVKRLILQPQEMENKPNMHEKSGQKDDSEQIKTKIKNELSIRKSKKLPTDFYNEILLNASLLSNPQEEPSEEPRLSLKDVLRKSMDLLDQSSRGSSARTSLHPSLKQSHFSRHTSQSKSCQVKRDRGSNLIRGFMAGSVQRHLEVMPSSTNILPGNRIPTMDMFQTNERNSQRQSETHCNSKTSMVSRSSSNFKLVKRELEVSARMSRKQKTRLSHDLRAFKVVAEPVGEGAEEGHSGESGTVPNFRNGDEKEATEGAKNSENVDAGEDPKSSAIVTKDIKLEKNWDNEDEILEAIDRKNFPKLFDLEQEIKCDMKPPRKRRKVTNVFKKDSSGGDFTDSPFKMRNEKSKAIYDSLSKDLKQILNKKCGGRLKQLRSKSNSLKTQSRDFEISDFGHKGIMTFRKRESLRSSFRNNSSARHKHTSSGFQQSIVDQLSREVFDEVHISYLNSTVFNSKVQNESKQSPLELERASRKRGQRIDQIELDLSRLKQKKELGSGRAAQNHRRQMRQLGRATPPRVATPLKGRKSRSPLHLTPNATFHPQPRMKKNYSQRYINTFKKGRVRGRNKENPTEPRAKGFCSIKYAALELKNQQRKLENILESCQNTFKKLDWNIQNLEEIQHTEDKRRIRERHSGLRRLGAERRRASPFTGRTGAPLRGKRQKERLSARRRINDLYRDFCKTMDFGRGTRGPRPSDKSSKLMRINLIKKKLNRL